MPRSGAAHVQALVSAILAADAPSVTVQPGWYPDPLSAGHLRWWSGAAWTESVQPLVPAQPAAAVQPAAPAQPRLDEGGDRADDVWLPPALVSMGQLPRVCVRHGRRADRTQSVAVFSKTPVWVLPIVVLSLLIGAIVALAVRKTVPGAWPMCDRCVAERNRFRHLMWASVAANLLVLVLSIVLASSVLFLLLIPGFVVAVVFGDLSSWRRLTNADVVRLSGAVHVRKPSQGFVAALPAPGVPFGPAGLPTAPAAAAGAIVHW